MLAYLAAHAPPVCDPFCGGGSIPLEAQRLGLRAYGSDLNPVAVLVSKATCEIPPKFAGCPPVNPERDPHVQRGRGRRAWPTTFATTAAGCATKRTHGSAISTRRSTITEAMAAARDDLKPYAGKELTVIAWLWVAHRRLS